MATNMPKSQVGMAYGSGMFTDEEVERVAKEVVDPDLKDYEFFTESHNTRIYRRYKEESGLYEYKTCGVMADLNPETCAQVYVDWEYRKVWDSYVMDLHPVHDDATGMDGLYWCCDYPWPLWDRDYTFIRDFRVMEVGGQKTWVVMARSYVFPSLPKKDGIVRIDDFQQACVMQSDGKVGSKAFMYYYDDPKGLIPTWLINWAAKTGVPHFMEMMRKAVLGYDDYLEKQRQELGLETVGQALQEARFRKMYNVQPDQEAKFRKMYGIQPAS